MKKNEQDILLERHWTYYLCLGAIVLYVLYGLYPRYIYMVGGFYSWLGIEDIIFDIVNFLCFTILPSVLLIRIILTNIWLCVRKRIKIVVLLYTIIGLVYSVIFGSSVLEYFYYIFMLLLYFSMQFHFPSLSVKILSIILVIIGALIKDFVFPLVIVLFIFIYYYPSEKVLHIPETEEEMTATLALLERLYCEKRISEEEYASVRKKILARF